MLLKNLFKAGAYGIMMLVELMTLIVMLAAMAGGFLLYRPQWIVNENNLRTVTRYVLPLFGVTMEFKSFQAEFPRMNIYDRGLGISFEKLRVKTDSLTFLAPTFGMAVGFNIHPDHMALTMIGPIVVEEGVFALKLPASDPYEEKEPFKWDDQLL